MNTMNASEAREKLYRLPDETASAREPLLITGPRTNAVLVGDSRRNNIQHRLVYQVLEEENCPIQDDPEILVDSNTR